MATVISDRLFPKRYTGVTISIVVCRTDRRVRQTTDRGPLVMG
jgi:hypothetical protein